MSISETATQLFEGLPVGYKPLAWHGFVIAVPQRWDIGRFAGTWAQGGMRIDDEQRIVCQIKWWKTNGPISLETVIEKQAKAMAKKEKRKGSAGDLTPASGIQFSTDCKWCAFETKDEGGKELSIAVQRADHARAAMIRFRISKAGQPDRATINNMLRGFALQNEDEPKAYAALDFAFLSPAELPLNKAALYSGVSYLRFSRFRKRVALRRFSNAIAVLGQDEPDLERLKVWCRATYSSEFFDRRYNIVEYEDGDGLSLIARPRLIALPKWRGLIPHHDPSPMRIEIQWDKQRNKINCLEVHRRNEFHDDAADVIEDTLRYTLDHSHATPLVLGEGKRARALAAHVLLNDAVERSLGANGKISVSYLAEKPTKLRTLRALAAQPIGDRTEKRTVELDYLGSRLLEACESKPKVIDVVKQLAKQFHISHREAELSVSHYIHSLGQRGLLVVEL